MENENFMTKTLSIIIPYYNRPEQIKRLIQVLKPQLVDGVEVIIVDDHSPQDIQDIELPPGMYSITLKENSGGASVPRNVGLDLAKGKYIAFIDSDDNVSPQYIKTILDKIKNSDFDYCYISWECSTHKVIIKNEPPSWNCCVWNCIYKKDLIGDIRFREDLIMAEDYYFNKEVRKGKRENIKEILYYYNQNSKDSLTKKGITYNEKYRSDN